MGTMQNSIGGCGSQAKLAGVFFNRLSLQAQSEICGLTHSCNFSAGITVFSEKDRAPGVYIVLEGEVKLSMNSTDGRRLILRIARKGDVLGLASALSGNPCEMTAETLYPSKLAPIGRQDFLRFMARHAEAYQYVTEELSRDYSMACEQLRTVGLSNSAPEKLARLLLDWSQNGQTIDGGAHCRFPLTHGEIGEFIGASRETVTRTLGKFKSRQLVAFHGSMLTIPSTAALESYAHC